MSEATTLPTEPTTAHETSFAYLLNSPMLTCVWLGRMTNGPVGGFEIIILGCLIK